MMKLVFLIGCLTVCSLIGEGNAAILGRKLVTDCGKVKALAETTFTAERLELTDEEKVELECPEGKPATLTYRRANDVFVINLEIKSGKITANGIEAIQTCFVLSYQMGPATDWNGVCPESAGAENDDKMIADEIANELRMILSLYKEKEAQELKLGAVKDAIVKAITTAHSDVQAMILTPSDEILESNPDAPVVVHLNKESGGAEIELTLAYVEHGRIEVKLDQGNSEYTWIWRRKHLDSEAIFKQLSPEQEENEPAKDKKAKEEEEEKEPESPVDALVKPKVQDIGIPTGLMTYEVPKPQGLVNKFFSLFKRDPDSVLLEDTINEAFYFVTFDKLIALLNDQIEVLQDQEYVLASALLQKSTYYRMDVTEFLKSVNKRHENKGHPRSINSMSNRDFVAVMPAGFNAAEINFGVKVGKVNPNRYVIDKAAYVVCKANGKECAEGENPQWEVKSTASELVTEINDRRTELFAEQETLTEHTLVYTLPKIHRVMIVRLYKMTSIRVSYLLRFITQFHEEEYLIPAMNYADTKALLKSIVGRVTVNYKDHAYGSLSVNSIVVNRAWLKQKIESALLSRVLKAIPKTREGEKCFCFKPSNDETLDVHFSKEKCKESMPFADCKPDKQGALVIHVSGETDSPRTMSVYANNEFDQRSEIYSKFQVQLMYDFNFEFVFMNWVSNAFVEGVLGQTVDPSKCVYPMHQFDLIPAPVTQEVLEVKEEEKKEETDNAQAENEEEKKTETEKVEGEGEVENKENVKVEEEVKEAE